MVVIEISLWPHGNKDKKRPLGEIKIMNNGTGDKEKGNYDVELSHSGIFFGKPGLYKTAKVNGHLRHLSPYHLLLNALKEALR